MLWASCGKIKFIYLWSVVIIITFLHPHGRRWLLWTISGGTKSVENASICRQRVYHWTWINILQCKWCLRENVQKDIYILHICMYTYILHICIYKYISHIPWKSKDHILPFGSTESFFIWIILATVRLAWSQTSRVTLFPWERPLLFCKPASLTKLPGCPTYT